MVLLHAENLPDANCMDQGQPVKNDLGSHYLQID